MIKQAENFVQNSIMVNPPSSVDITKNKEKVTYIIQKLQKIGCHTYVVDMSIPEIKQVGLSVAKVLVPEMVPLFHNEKYPYLGIKRLAKIPLKYGFKPKKMIESDFINNYPF